MSLFNSMLSEIMSSHGDLMIQIFYDIIKYTHDIKNIESIEDFNNIVMGHITNAHDSIVLSVIANHKECQMIANSPFEASLETIEFSTIIDKAWSLYLIINNQK